MGAQENPAAPTRKDLKESIEKLNMSKDEMDKFEKAFKDPEFIKMFAEYAQEISDPKNRAETDAYLRQMEAESRVEEVYGKGVQLIVPQEGFVAKTTQKGTGTKMFINICHSDKVEPCKGTRTADPSNPARTGMSWEIPLSLGKPKSGKDKKGKECDVIDFVVHPNTKEMAVRDARFRGMVVETAMENIEKNYGIKLDRSWTQPKMTYKGVEGAEQPHAMAVRSADSDAEVVDGKIKPKTASTSSEVKHNVGDSAKVAEDLQPASKSSFKFPEAKKKVQMLKPSKPGDIGYKYVSGEVCPEYQVVERGAIDMAAAWGDAGRGLDTSINVPKALVLRVELPGCTSAAGMELDLEKKAVCLCIPGKYKLEKKLNHEVDDSKAKAKFDKTQQRLEVTLPVIPPPPKAPMQAASGKAPAKELQLVQEMNDQSTPEHEQTSGTVEPPVTSEVKSDEPVDPESSDAPELSQRTQQQKSAIQKQFEDMMRKHDETAQKQQAEAAVLQAKEAARIAEENAKIPALPASDDGAFVETGGSFMPSDSFRGARPGYKFQAGAEGLGYYIDDKQAVAKVPAASTTSKGRAANALAAAGLAAPTSSGLPSEGASHAKQLPPPMPKLRPRLNNSLAEELD